MNICPQCHVTIRTPADNCPLCQGELCADPTGLPPRAEYPNIPLESQKHSMVINILLASTIFVAVVCLIVNYFFPAGGQWSLIVVGSLLFSWVLVRNTIQRQNSLMYLSRVIIPAALLLLLIDGLYGFHRWSTNYVIPALCFSAIMAVFVIAIIRGLRSADFVIYILITSVMALIPIVFMLTDLATVNWPSLVCVIFGALSILLVLAFSTQEMREELRRRFHM